VAGGPLGRGKSEKEKTSTKRQQREERDGETRRGGLFLGKGRDFHQYKSPQGFKKRGQQEKLGSTRKRKKGNACRPETSLIGVDARKKVVSHRERRD